VSLYVCIYRSIHVIPGPQSEFQEYPEKPCLKKKKKKKKERKKERKKEGILTITTITTNKKAVETISGPSPPQVRM